MSEKFTSESIRALWSMFVDLMPTPEDVNSACLLLRQVEAEVAAAEARGFARAREMAAQLIELSGAECSDASKRRLAKAIRAMQYERGEGEG